MFALQLIRFEPVMVVVPFEHKATLDALEILLPDPSNGTRLKPKTFPPAF